MAETLVGYRGRFEKAWRPYWRKWLATKPLRTDRWVFTRVASDGCVETAEIHTYAVGFTEKAAPEPEELCVALDAILQAVHGGYAPFVIGEHMEDKHRRPAYWCKPEGVELDIDPPLPTPVPGWTPEPGDTGRLVIRKPFQVSIGPWYGNRIAEDILKVRGRFGVFVGR